jgi:hypothetical protein
MSFRRPSTSGDPVLFPQDPVSSVFKPEGLLIGLLAVQVPAQL